MNPDEGVTVAPSTPANVMNHENDKQLAFPLVIVLSDDEDNEIPDPFRFLQTYCTNIAVSLHTGRQMFIGVYVDTIINSATLS